MQSDIDMNYQQVFIQNNCLVSKVGCPQKVARTRKSVFRLFVSPLRMQTSYYKVFGAYFFFPDYLQAPQKVQKETHSLVLLLLKPKTMPTKRHLMWSRKPSSYKPNNTSNKHNKMPLSRAEKNIKNITIKLIIKRVINYKSESNNIKVMYGYYPKLLKTGSSPSCHLFLHMISFD